MECERWIDAISARADGEDPGLEPALVDAHLRRCARCAAFAAELVDAAPSPAVVAPVGSDAAPGVVTAARRADRARTSSLVRWALGATALVMAGLALPDLLASTAHDAHVHGDRHLGAFTLAYAVGLGVVVVRPARAATMVPVAQVLTAAVALTAAVDVVAGRVPIVGEAVHLLELASAVLVVLLAREQRRGPRRTHRPARRRGAPRHRAPAVAQTE